MSSLPANPNIPVLTPDQQGVFFDLIKNNAPGWLLTASSQLRRERYESLITNPSRSELGDILKGYQVSKAVKVEGQAELSRAVATERLNAIFDNFKNERRALLRQLTGAALARHPAAPVPSSSAHSGASR